MPRPFTRGVFICGNPVYVARNADDDTMERTRLDLEKTLTELTERADTFFEKS